MIIQLSIFLIHIFKNNNHLYFYSFFFKYIYNTKERRKDKDAKFSRFRSKNNYCPIRLITQSV